MLSSALVALTRISRFLIAEELEEPYLINESLEAAVIVNGDFTWEKTGSSAGSAAEQGTETANETGKRKKKKSKEDNKAFLPTTAVEVEESQAPAEESKEDDSPFELKNLKMKIPKGSFVAIVGQIGSGKVGLQMVHDYWNLMNAFQSSILQSLIGEMRRTRGEASFPMCCLCKTDQENR
jgi:ATP-binding cassette, subfamily C (CFTR/MRP), member 1